MHSRLISKQQVKTLLRNQIGNRPEEYIEWNIQSAFSSRTAILVPFSCRVFPIGFPHTASPVGYLLVGDDWTGRDVRKCLELCKG